MNTTLLNGYEDILSLFDGGSEDTSRKKRNCSFRVSISRKHYNTAAAVTGILLEGAEAEQAKQESASAPEPKKGFFARLFG